MTIDQSLAKFVRWVMRDTTYHRVFPCSVQGQSSDLATLDLLPDDTDIRGTGLQQVHIRHGLPGVQVKVPVGARVLLGFEAGDPERPYAALWEPGAIEQIIFDHGTKPLARKGDAVTCFWPPSVPITGTVGPAALEGSLTITSPAPGIIAAGAERALG
jgi:hypothetical protein